ncbi:MAG: glycosyltransferase family 2 protein [Candidatus Diapherotrites archaeon]|nr:glycosyltransferase family 2 protein [Candidatus Micrarchaeota archaeon]MBU1939814.1 glycosyltransferase family 2 protein [Candidatus Micrarchaeota archaeon]
MKTIKKQKNPRRGAKLVVLIPALNEEKTIGGVISSIPKKINGIGEIAALVVDDGSTDNTTGAAKAKGAKVVSHSVNRGLGVAFSTGIENALGMGADVIVNIDADGQFNSGDIAEIVQPVLRGEADMVTCSRFLDRDNEPEMPAVKKFGNAVFTRIVNALTGGNFTDTQCGFRAYSRDAAMKMTLFHNYTYTQEAFLNLANRGCKIVEMPFKVTGQREGKSRIVGNVFVYGIRALVIIVRTIRDYKPLEFFASIGAGFLAIGFALGTAIFIHWLSTGMTSPYTSLISVSVLMLVLGFILIVLALIADMNERQRKMQEEILYMMKKGRGENSD